MRKTLAKAGILGLLLLLLVPVNNAEARWNLGSHRETKVEPQAVSGPPDHKAKILFIPHDNRPTSCEQTAAVVQELGYDVIMPDKKLLGGLTTRGDTEELWKWTKENAKDAEVAVIATDSLVYGGLVTSRVHEIPRDTLRERANRLHELREMHPSLKIYAFTSLMRTPRSGAASGGEDPDYYFTYGTKIFRYTALMDKAEVEGLSEEERQELAQLTQEIPAPVLKDWLGRRQHNLEATKMMIDDARAGKIDYLLIGKDDNASLSQTHREDRWLREYSKNIPDSRFHIVAGIDEFAMLLMTRAVNQWEQIVPKVAIRYNIGKGGDTIPTYSDERIAATLRTELEVSGGQLVDAPGLADFTLLVNTTPEGITGEANHVREWEPAPLNNWKNRPGTYAFLEQVQTLIRKGCAVGIADIAFSNGSDNVLMYHLKSRNLLFKLKSYSGWNTGTNSLGFALGQGMLASRLPQEKANELLMIRYLDDWAYQANVRTAVAHKIERLGNPMVYLYLGEYELEMEEDSTRLLRQFCRDHLPEFKHVDDLHVTFPWHRMFIASIRYDGMFDFKHS